MVVDGKSHEESEEGVEGNEGNTSPDGETTISAWDDVYDGVAFLGLRKYRNAGWVI